MILKLKEIHQYTHQLVSSDSEDEPPLAAHAAPTTSLATSSAAAPIRPVSCSRTVTFKEPSVPATVSVTKPNTTEEEEPLSASQGSNTSSTAASEESDRYSIVSGVVVVQCVMINTRKTNPGNSKECITLTYRQQNICVSPFHLMLQALTQ